MSRRLAALALFALGLFLAARLLGSGGVAAPPVELAKGVVPEERGDSGEVALPALGGEQREDVAAPREDSGPLLSLRVATWQGRRDAAQPVPHVELDVGVSPDFGTTWLWSASLETDAEGFADVEVPWNDVVAARAGENPWLCARVHSAGFQRRRWLAKLPEELAPAEFSVKVFPGTTLRGRLLSPDGEGVRGRLRGEQPGETGRLVAWSDEAGDFELHLERESPLTLVATAQGAGTARVGPLPITLDPLPDPVDVVLTGPGVVRGRVTDGRGEPAAGLDLLVREAWLDDGDDQRIRRAALAEEGLGLVELEARTDAAGRFEARGLREGSFVVRARTEGEGEYPVRLTGNPVPADGVALELVLARPHLVVQLRSADGTPYAGEVLAQPPRVLRRRDAPEAWPEELLLGVALDGEDWGEEPESPGFLPGRMVAPGELVYEVEDDRYYQVGLLGPGLPWAPREVRVPPLGGRVELVVEVPERTPTGRLSVEVFGPDGVQLTDDVRLRVLAADGQPLVSKDSFFRETWPQVLELPVGRYRVEVTGHAFIDTHHGTLMTPRASGRFEAPVRIEADRTHDLVASLPSGARVHLVLEGEPDESDREAVIAEGVGEEYVEGQARTARLFLVSELLRPEPVPFLFVGGWGDYESHWIALGSELTSQVLSAGRYRLVARLPGGRTCSTPVELVDGETTSVALRFD